MNKNIRIDYNFASIPVFLGLIGILFKLPKQNSFIGILIANLILFIFSLNILFSGSRRGFLLLSLIIFIIFIASILNTFKIKNLLTDIGNKAKYLILIISIFVGVFYIFLFHTSIDFKFQILRTISSKDLYHSKIFITQKLYKLSTITKKEISYNELYNNIWPKTLDPVNPDTWGEIRVHKIKHPLQGKNIEMLPEGAKGYLMNSTCNASTWRGNAYSYTRIANDSVLTGNIVESSVYCYVTNDFDGKWVKLNSEGQTFGNIASYYNLQKKGTWQKLSISAYCKKGKAPVYLYFAKYGVTDFSTLKGHVIFAYPQYKVLNIKETPKDPDSGWGTRTHKTIFPLTGQNVKIIPKDSKGYLLDNTTNPSTWRNNAYSYTRIGFDSVSTGDLVKASVYCYVSKDFDGQWVRLSSEGSTYGNKKVNYDLNNKGIWQKLVLKVPCKKGKAPVYLYFAKYGVTDFSTLKGHVIFAYPQYKVIRKDSLQSFIIPEKFKEEKTRTNTPLSVSKINKYKAGLIQNLKTYSKTKKTYYHQAAMFNFSLPNIIQTDTSQIDTDPIRNWIAKLVSEDTTYYPFTANIVVDSVADHFIAPRTVRWQFAWQLFTKEYNWKQKLFGHGFDYLNWYGYYFYKDKTKSDWPHNPFLSVLLYSGIFGLLFYLLLLYKVFYYYIKYIKVYYILYIFFLITFYFFFFSGNSPFGMPVMDFFIILPFLIHSVHKVEEI